MKNRKGQIGMGIIIVTFVAILLGAIFLQAIAQEVGKSTNLVAIANDTNTATANGGTFYVTGYKVLTDVEIYNSTGGGVIAAGNYTVTDNVVNNGELTVSITVDDAEYEGYDWDVSGTAQPTTYISDGGGRAMASLIVIMFALAVLVVALSPTVSGKLAEMIGN